MSASSDDRNPYPPPVTEAAAPTEAGGAAATPRSALYRAVWRWHFYAGLFAIPFIVVLCLSGIVYLFRPQLDGLLYGDMRNVAPRESTVSLDQQRDAVEKRYPDGYIAAIATPPDDRRATQFDVEEAQGGTVSVFVNPYTGAITGVRDNDTSPIQISLLLHGSLWSGAWLGSEKWGDYALEAVAGWSVLLLITGIILWWPRGQRRGTLKGVVVPRVRTHGKRTRWRDIHAVTGVLFSFVSLFFFITGLAWTGVWGEKYTDVASSLGGTYPPEVLNGVSSRSVADLPAVGKAPWAAGALEAPSSTGGGGAHAGHGGDDGLTWDPKDGAPLDAVVARARDEGLPRGITLWPPGDETGTWTAVRGWDLEPTPDTSALDGRFVFIDQYTAETVSDVGYGDYGPMVKASDFGIALHTGREWGLWSQILMLVGTLAILLSVASSIVMWRRRRPRGLGAPTRVASRRVTIAALAVAAVLGVLFPLLGITLLAALVLDQVVIRRIPPLRRAFGAG